MGWSPLEVLAGALEMDNVVSTKCVWCAWAAIVVVALTGVAASAQGRAATAPTTQRAGESPTTQKRTKPAPLPAAVRRNIAEQIAAGIAKGSISNVELARLLDQGSVGALPARQASRQELATAVADSLTGRSVARSQAGVIAYSLAPAADIDMLVQNDIDVRRRNLQIVLLEVGATQTQITKVTFAYDKAIHEQQQPNLIKLAGGLKAIQAGSETTSQQLKDLQAALAGLPQGVNKPSQESIDKLASDLGKPMAGKVLPAREQARLVYDLQAALNSAGLSPQEFAATLEAVKAVLKAATLAPADIQVIAADLHSLRAGKPATHPTTTSAPARKAK